MDNPHLEIRSTGNRGNGVFAVSPIVKGTLIAEFDGAIHHWNEEFTQDMEDHCIQFEERQRRDSKGLARLVNHSCEPNCGIQDQFNIVAMRDIAAGEEVTWDYDMSEDTDASEDPYHWKMPCHCGSAKCRGSIGSFANLPAETRRQYAGYISQWLVAKYGL